MEPATEQLLQEALGLPEGERQELIDALLATRDSSGPLPFDPAWLVEVRRRSAEVEAGSVPLTPWSEVRERVRRRLEGKSRG
jgi:putative addiction module component (TIGR02574 family)